MVSCNDCAGSPGESDEIVSISSESDHLYHRYKSVSDDGWLQGDTLVFELPMFDTSVDLDVAISVRFTNHYPYRNLEFFAFLTEQDTANIISSLPLLQNDALIDSLINIQDSIFEQQAREEQAQKARMHLRDSLLRVNPDSLLRLEQAEALMKDSLIRVYQQRLEYEDSLRGAEEGVALSESHVMTDREKDSIHHQQLTDSLLENNLRLRHTINFDLYTATDSKCGSGVMFLESTTDCGVIHLKSYTRYKIIIYHHMNSPCLKGITDIGISLRRNMQEKPLFNKARWY